MIVNIILLLVLLVLILWAIELYGKRNDSTGDSIGPAFIWGIQVAICILLLLSDCITLLIRVL